MKRSERDIAERLCIMHGINVKQARYREDGRWYHHLTAFPAAFLDKNGYIIFPTRSDYQNCSKLDLQQDVNLHDKRGIKSITGYTRFAVKAETSNRLPDNVDERSSVVEEPTAKEFDEGGTREIALEIQRRSPQLRRSAIKHYGTRCQVCGFDFGVAYGILGEGFIEIHHRVPLSLRRESEVTTLEDVTVVCSNCHRMLHRNGVKPMSVEQLKQVFAKELVKNNLGNLETH